MTTDIPIACNLDALSSPERQRRASLATAIRDRVVDTRETENGFRLELGPDSALHAHTLELISLERRCCPFLELKLAFSPGDGPVYFEIGGREGVKAFLAASGLLGCGQ